MLKLFDGNHRNESKILSERELDGQENLDRTRSPCVFDLTNIHWYGLWECRKVVFSIPAPLLIDSGAVVGMS